jgi:hypothetical protein
VRERERDSTETTDKQERGRESTCGLDYDRTGTDIKIVEKRNIVLEKEGWRGTGVGTYGYVVECLRPKGRDQRTVLPFTVYKINAREVRSASGIAATCMHIIQLGQVDDPMFVHHPPLRDRILRSVLIDN